jgi:hypothetical protein
MRLSAGGTAPTIVAIYDTGNSFTLIQIVASAGAAKDFQLSVIYLTTSDEPL